MNELVRAMVIPTDGEPRTGMVTQECGEIIRSIVGGHFGVVASDEGVHGYVHDEGLLIGLPYNAVASALFGQPIVGNVIVFGSLDAKGRHDGYEHHIPPTVVVLAMAEWEIARHGL